MFFESHAHYDDQSFNEDRDEILASLQKNGVDYVINAGSDIQSSKASIKLADEYSFIYAAVGVHPHEVSTLNNLEELEGLCGGHKVVALGEIGLDFYYDNSPRDIQRYWFNRQLDLAGRLKLPVIIHSREAAAETFDIIKGSNIRQGVIHCYSGSIKMALDYIEMGFFIGIGGVITFEKAKRVKEVAREIPLDHILIETDAPYLAPVPHRGKRNNSNYLKFIAAKIAEIKGLSLNYVAETTYTNAYQLFQIESA